MNLHISTAEFTIYHHCKPSKYNWRGSKINLIYTEISNRSIQAEKTQYIIIISTLNLPQAARIDTNGKNQEAPSQRRRESCGSANRHVRRHQERGRTSKREGGSGTWGGGTSGRSAGASGEEDSSAEREKVLEQLATAVDAEAEAEAEETERKGHGGAEAERRKIGGRWSWVGRRVIRTISLRRPLGFHSLWPLSVLKAGNRRDHTTQAFESVDCSAPSGVK